jgi:tRNA(Ile)-lysidine synthase
LNRSARVLREEDRWLNNIAKSELSQCRAAGGGRALCVGSLADRDPALRRRVLRRWLSAAGVPVEQLGFCSIDRVESLVTREKGAGKVEVGGRWTVRRSYDRLTVEKSKAEIAGPEYRQALAVPGETVVAEAGLCITTELRAGIVKPACPRIGVFPAEASVSRAAAGRRRIFVRSRAPGDRIKPFGLQGTRKLQDIFVDEKVPVELRTRVPVLECGGRIIWLPGYRIARGWEVRRPEVAALQIRIEAI